ncbi:MAG TPA: ribosome rescue protein RqcH [Thermoplasmata archaeon]|jgi:predicted ribosome quality control (RQC) complex YloA/Tae2 family protein|nr:ribosome rescue protein RqcH [Thermoplasmata archaeon]
MAATVVAEKDRFTSLDSLAVARELRTLGRAHVDKAVDVGADRVALTLRAPGSGKRALLVRPGQYAAVLDAIADRDEGLSPLAKELRRVLGGAALVAIPDPGGERYLEAEFSRGDAGGPLTLGVELFGAGNLLVARDGKLVVVAHPKTWSNRSVRVGAPYSRPPVRVDPFQLDVPGIETLLRASRTDRTSTLAARLGLGGPLAEEVVTRTGVSGEGPAANEPGEFAPLVRRALADLVDEVGDRPKGYLYSLDGTPVDVTPFESRRLLGRTGITVEATTTFSEAAHRYFDGRAERVAPVVSAADGQRAEWERQRRQQEAAVAELRTQASDLTRQADLLLAHYPEVEARMASAGEARSGEDSVVVTLEDVAIPVARGQSIRAVAQARYEEAKRAQAKLAGAVAALAQSDERLAKEVRATLAETPKATAAVAARRRTPNWYERYRWFHTSEGILVIGGRDAATNDLIVRRYLNPGDKYVHADIHGAPSVVVKHPPPGDAPWTDASLEEAAQWGVAFSKAWRAGLASASAFAVEADQVSKQGASGEFVARGAWVIHGTKLMFKDLPTELGLGTTDDRGETLWVVAPPRSFSGRGKVVYVLSPGPERERDEREVELSRATGLSRDRLQSLLPSGGLSFRRA